MMMVVIMRLLPMCVMIIMLMSMRMIVIVNMIVAVFMMLLPMMMSVKIIHIVIVIFMLCIQLYKKITCIQCGLFYSRHFCLKSLNGKARKCLLKHFLICSQIKKCSHRHISTDS